MKKRPFVLFFSMFLFALSAINAQKGNSEYYAVGFYNLENLFDTIHDAGKNDYEFLPDGKYRWNTLKYTNKLKNMATVLGEMGSDVSPAGMAVVGVCEVENSRVLKELVGQEILAKRGWDFVHIEGPDKRGIDCALLYNPKLFKPLDSKLLPYITQENDTTYKTRGFLLVSGEMGGEKVHIIVNHWPSRSVKSPVRERAGALVRQLKDSLVNIQPESRIIVMGDMNDNPDDRSVSVALGAVREKNKAKKATDLYNPWWNISSAGGSKGTLKYNGKWLMFDQILLSGNMLGGSSSVLKFYKAEIFKRDYLFHHEGRYKGDTKRTHAGGVWLDGYSDHLPVILYFVKGER